MITMCRLLISLKKIKNKKVINLLKKHAIELEGILGGHGNGIFLLESKKIYKSFDCNKIANHINAEPFFFHTRYATGNNISVKNCHPFTYQEYVFMHNGTCKQYTFPKNHPDSYNLLKYYVDSNGKQIDNLNWKGNLIFYNKELDLIYFYLKRNKYNDSALTYVKFIDGSVILTSQLTACLAKSKLIKSSIVLDRGIYVGQFYSDKIELIEKYKTPLKKKKFKFKSLNKRYDYLDKHFEDLDKNNDNFHDINNTFTDIESDDLLNELYDDYRQSEDAGYKNNFYVPAKYLMSKK